jgi:hypothetical protein
VARLTAALETERRRAAAAEGQVTKLKNASLSDQERAVAEAKLAGRTEALQGAGAKLAAAEFRAAAAGRLADPAAALEVVDLAKFVNDQGEVDSAKITGLVDKLAGLAPPPTPGSVPGGPRGGAPSDDFLGAGLRGTR